MAVDDFTRPQRRLLMFMYKRRNPVTLLDVSELFTESKARNKSMYLRTVDRLEKAGLIEKMTASPDTQSGNQLVRYTLTDKSRHMAMFTRDCLADLGLTIKELLKESELSKTVRKG
jgi:DNA-binding MarR family transcriptional regulator